MPVLDMESASQLPKLDFASSHSLTFLPRLPPPPTPGFLPSASDTALQKPGRRGINRPPRCSKVYFMSKL